MRSLPLRFARTSALPLVFAPSLALALSLLGACSVPVDVSTPGGLIHATVQYIGPRPNCTYVMQGTQMVPTGFVGRFVFTLVDVANPLPPAGTAQMPADMITLDAQYVFTDLKTQCFDPADPNTNIQVTAAFDVHHVKLAQGVGAKVTYNLQGFWDRQGDFNPLTSVTQTTNDGDIVGAALADPTAPVPTFKAIEFGSVEDNPNGVVVDGVNVMFAASQATVVTDPDVFYVAQDGGAIASDAPWPVDLSPQYSAPQISLRLFGRAATDADRAAIDTVRTATNTSSLADFGNVDEYAWYRKGFLINGQPAYHPIWGNLMAPTRALWTTPVLFLQRVQNAIETECGVPSVAMVPLADPTESKQAYYPTIPFGVPQVAAVQLNPAIPGCTVAYMNDGSMTTPMNVAPSASNGPATCEEFPTGFYGANVLSGNAGGTFANASTSVSDTGRDLTGGQFASQVWRLPNAYGDAAQVGAAHVVQSQGTTGTVLVHDPNPSSPGGLREARAAGDTSYCSTGPNGFGTAPYDIKTWPNDPGNTMGPTAATQQNCCEGVRHLCDVPLCPYTDVTPTWSTTSFHVRGQPDSFTTNADGQKVPNCVPFPMPQQCCERYGM